MEDTSGTVVALLSGGKDSLFALHCCVHFGYVPEVIAHIRPSDIKGETDSYMYQTVGSQVIEAIASCLDLPLVVHQLAGTPIAINALDYTFTNGDEVEDLYALLSRVKELYPNVRYISTGAILSDYQRCRVEHVCRRLGLTSLAFLWKFQQSVLIRFMASTPDFDAILIKVASMGLSKAELGQSVTSLVPKLLRMESEFGFNACGEGGEYETTTLNSPLFRRTRVFVPSWDIKVHSDDAFAPVLYFAPSAPVTTVPKNLDTAALTLPSLQLAPLTLILDCNRYYFLDFINVADVASFVNALPDCVSLFRSAPEICDGNDHHMLLVNDTAFSFFTPDNTTLHASYLSPPFLTAELLPKVVTSDNPSAIACANSEENVQIKSHASPLSRSLWRASSTINVPYIESFTVNEKAIVTQWVTGRLPHSANFPDSTDSQHNMLTEFVISLRNLRNLLRDRGSGFHLVHLLDVLFVQTPSSSISVFLFSQILTAVWNCNYAGHSRHEDVEDLLRAREKFIWDSAITRQHLNSVATQDFHVCQTDDGISSNCCDNALRPILRFWKTDYLPFGGTVAVKAVAAVRTS